MFKGITMLAVTFAMLICGVFSGVMTTTAYARDQRLPARFMATHRVNMYDRPGGTLNGGWFDHTSPGEQRVINWGPVANGREYWEIEYNLFAGGTRRGWARRSDLIQGRINQETFQVILPRDTQVFERPNLARNFGTVWGGNRARDMGYNYAVVLNRQGNSVQIVYRLANGGGRIGWIRLSDMQGAERRGNTAWFDRMGPIGGSFSPVWPTRGGWISQGDFNSSGGRHSTRHGRAIDIAVSTGTPVFATEAGTVRAVRNLGNSSFGRYIEIRHDNGAISLYAHLSRQDVRVDQRVTRGQQIGLSGNSGNSTGPHLHFELSNSTRDRMTDFFPGR